MADKNSNTSTNDQQKPVLDKIDRAKADVELIVNKEAVLDTLPPPPPPKPDKPGTD